MKITLVLLAIITTFLTPIQGLLIIMFMMVMLDTAFGIYVSIKIESIKSFKSHKLFNIVIKLFFYLTTIILAFLVNKYIAGKMLFGIEYLIPKIVTATWSYIELKSLDESSMKLGNKSFWVIFKEMINKLKGMKTDLNELIDDKKEDTK
ncbi:phage holin family protein [Flavobacterium muglaense]|uniref:Phage holin family protein n=1 Tax=Flavobacterium muglaense TaxID=2764716 RepID=A0A923N034_9FLAO|nr:phage holin family protein [Flavobacterium muglaense]MBC5836787.1 phage holin family protein [Flavobacterium muglaense]MBC5843263.1 phage holin family protein [Flavobacterium muglaense]